MTTSADQPDLRSVTSTEACTLLEAQEASGLSIAAFAREHGIRPWSLYNARAAARRNRDSAAVFSEVRVVEESPEQAPVHGDSLEISLPSGLSIRIGRGFDEVTLRRVLGILATC